MVSEAQKGVTKRSALSSPVTKGKGSALATDSLL